MQHDLTCWAKTSDQGVLVPGALALVLFFAPGFVTEANPLPNNASSDMSSPVVFQLRMQASINPLNDRLEISESHPLSFGSFLPVTAGSITITPEGGVTFSGEFASQSAFHEGDHNAGELDLTGIASQNAHLEISSLSVLEGPGEPLLITGIQLLDAQGNNIQSGGSLRFDEAGQASIRYGATLTFSEGQEPGNYAGETQITMNY